LPGALQVAWSQGGGNTFLGQQMAQPSDFSAHTADLIDNEVKLLVETAYRRAKDLVQSNMGILHKVCRPARHGLPPLSLFHLQLLRHGISVRCWQRWCIPAPRRWCDP
jgi:hypothetical protein